MDKKVYTLEEITKLNASELEINDLELLVIKELINDAFDQYYMIVESFVNVGYGDAVLLDKMKVSILNTRYPKVCFTFMMFKNLMGRLQVELGPLASLTIIILRDIVNHTN